MGTEFVGLRLDCGVGACLIGVEFGNRLCYIVI